MEQFKQENEFNIIEVINSLDPDNRLFVSEADMQFRMAFAIKEKYPHVQIRLEYPVKINEKTIFYIDILVITENGKWIPIELKYKTKKNSITIEGETFELKEQGARDTGCYLYLKDIERLENIQEKYKKEGKFEKGYAVMLTNDMGYVNKNQKKQCVYEQFRLDENRIKSGTMEWSKNASDGTKKGYEDSICLKGSYKMEWQPYCETDAYTFKYLCTQIG